MTTPPAAARLALAALPLALVLAAVAAPPTTRAGPSPEACDRMREHAEASGARVGFVVLDLTDWTRCTHRAGELFATASLYKLFVLAEAHDQARREVFSFDETLEFARWIPPPDPDEQQTTDEQAPPEQDARDDTDTRGDDAPDDDAPPGDADADAGSEDVSPDDASADEAPVQDEDAPSADEATEEPNEDATDEGADAIDEDAAEQQTPPEPEATPAPTTRIVEMDAREAARLMIQVSDNETAYALAERLTWRAVREAPRRLGMTATTLAGENYTTNASDIAAFFTRLHAGRLLGPAEDAAMLDMLRGQLVRDRIPRLLPDDVEIAHKTGRLDAFANDAGIVYAPGGPFVLVLLTESDETLGPGYEAIRTLAAMAYEAFAEPRAPLPPAAAPASDLLADAGEAVRYWAAAPLPSATAEAAPPPAPTAEPTAAPPSIIARAVSGGATAGQVSGLLAAAAGLASFVWFVAWLARRGE